LRANRDVDGRHGERHNEFFSRLVTQLTERLVARGADLATTGDLLASPARRKLATSIRI
jgi:hypothetical protein